MEKKTLRFFYANIRSLVKHGKLEEIRCIIDAFKCPIHIILLTETWIKNDEEAQRLKLPSYTHYYNYRTDSRGGGVSLYIHNDLKHHLIDEEYSDGNHFLWVHVSTLSLDIGVVYKQPAANNITFLEKYQEHLKKKKRLIVFGDFNLDLLSNEKSIRDYKELLKENNVKILNKLTMAHCTRETATSKTILDHACTNLLKNNFKITLIDSSISDHKQIYLEIVKCFAERRRKIQFESINYNNFYKSVENILISNNIDQYNILEAKILQAISSNKTLKTKILNPPSKEWINKSLITLINKRNECWNKLKLAPDDEELKKEFIHRRSLAFLSMQSAKNKYFYKCFNKNGKDPLKMWQLINKLTNYKNEITRAPSKLITQSGYTTNIKEMCQCFNIYFSTIGSELASKIPHRFHCNLAHTATYSVSDKNKILNRFEPTTTQEVIEIINNLDNNTSSGLDGITTKTIKCIKNVLAENMANCVNKCFDAGYFPDTLKIAKVSPLFKSGSKSDPGNYRPISVLPVMSKIFEKIIHNRLLKYLKSIDFLFNKQYGFRPKSNTVAATVDLVTKIRLHIDNNKICLGIFIDMKKAFDTISHDLLLLKLKSIGVTGIAFDTLKSYLTNRHQVVKIGNEQSDPRLITCGVPQGSILGPLLFLVYINNIHEIGLKGDITLYADDTSLFYFGHSIDSIISTAQDDLQILHTWLQSNLLTINISKTKYIIFAAKNKKIGNYNPLSINGEIIDRVNKEKYLGLILDHQLTWKHHIEKICNKLNSLRGALRGIVRCLPKCVRYTIYNSLAKSHIDYLIEVWGTAAKTNLQKLQTSQNKLIKTLFRYNFLTPTIQIYNETKLFNIFQTYKFNTCVLIRKILNNSIHTQIKLTKKIDFHHRQTRRANEISLKPFRTKYGRKSIYYEGAQHYNKLPKNIKDMKQFYKFKKYLKAYISKDPSH